MMDRALQCTLLALFVLFCCSYPIALTGVAFDVRPPFSMAWAGSALLFLEAILLIVAASCLYGWRKAARAGLLVIGLSYVVEAIGVNTGFPFGAYRYTAQLVPQLPASVPLPVMCAWILIVFGAYSWVQTVNRISRINMALLGAVLATLLDLAIEPVAAHVVGYWLWLHATPMNYYGVPLANFGAWFVVAWLLLSLVAAIFALNPPLTALTPPHPAHPGQGNHKGCPYNGTNTPRKPIRTIVGASFMVALPGVARETRLASFIPRFLFASSLFMFAFIDLTHGYYGGCALAVVAGLILVLLPKLAR